MPFEFTWDEVIRLFQHFSLYERQGRIRSREDLIELLKRSEIGQVSSKDVEFFYAAVGLQPGAAVSFPL